MANFGPLGLTAQIGSGAWGTPANFNGFRVLPSLPQLRRSPEAHQTLHDVWRLLAGALYILYIGLHFQRLLPPDIILPGAKLTLRPSLAFAYIGSVTHGTSAAGVSQTLRHGRRTKNGITELLQREPFGMAAIMLGIDPHSISFEFYITFVVR